MTGSAITKATFEEGYQAAKSGANEWDNPYNYITEPQAAYGWEEGYRTAKKEGGR